MTMRDSTQVRRARRNVKFTEQLLLYVQIQYEMAKHELQLRRQLQAKDRSTLLMPGHQISAHKANGSSDASQHQ
jgi:hypothetical protein